MKYRPGDLAILALLALVWGLAFLFIHLGLRSFSPLLFGALRLDIIALAMFAAVLVRHRHIPVPSNANQWRIIVIAAILNVGLYNALLNWALLHTTPGITGVVIGLNPILTAFFAHLLLPHERVRLHHAAGLAIGFCGIVLLAALRPGPIFDVQGLAETAIAVAIGAWALGSVLVRRSQHAMDVYAFIAWHCLLGGVLLHLVALVVEDGGRAHFDLLGVSSLLFLALVSGGLGFALFYQLLDRVGALRSNIVSYFTPIVANLSGLIVLDQAVELRAIAAFVLLAAGFALVAYREERPAAAPQEMPVPPEEASPRPPATR